MTDDTEQFVFSAELSDEQNDTARQLTKGNGKCLFAGLAQLYAEFEGGWQSYGRGIICCCSQSLNCFDSCSLLFLNPGLDGMPPGLCWSIEISPQFELVSVSELDFSFNNNDQQPHQLAFEHLDEAGNFVNKLNELQIDRHPLTMTDRITDPLRLPTRRRDHSNWVEKGEKLVTQLADRVFRGKTRELSASDNREITIVNAQPIVSPTVTLPAIEPSAPPMEPAIQKQQPPYIVHSQSNPTMRTDPRLSYGYETPMAEPKRVSNKRNSYDPSTPSPNRFSSFSRYDRDPINQPSVVLPSKPKAIEKAVVSSEVVQVYKRNLPPDNNYLSTDEPPSDPLPASDPIRYRTEMSLEDKFTFNVLAQPDSDNCQKESVRPQLPPKPPTPRNYGDSVLSGRIITTEVFDLPNKNVNDDGVTEEKMASFDRPLYGEHSLMLQQLARLIEQGIASFLLFDTFRFYGFG